MSEFLQPVRIGSPILGAVLPAAVFAVSFVLTYLLIRRFMKGL
ncbi:MAG: hypothetical protein ONB30_00725 [candidate division KSB1 bacterium]|nr:hypothetical protein [candidate division KSB1 bacterium]MDZ7296306.1 hypothetical protein [candidate division KSB1 bacterium]MDZ7337041.1 hypothetical protein [candidate division KSB1 bacterium]MDZ7384682.1 hypothetical protein [candidate division KSB1 bacterium]MDZ7392251.1 hypothetical protein [candidate division KSB1 bacterium]